MFCEVCVLGDPTSRSSEDELRAALARACEETSGHYAQVQSQIPASAACGFIRQARTGRLAALHVLDLSVLNALEAGLSWPELAVEMRLPEQTCKDRYERRWRHWRATGELHESSCQSDCHVCAGSGSGSG